MAPYVWLIFPLFLVILETRQGQYREWWRDPQLLVEAILSLVNIFVVSILAIFASAKILHRLFPELRNSLSSSSFVLVFLFTLVSADFFHYLMHRALHRYPSLWRLHYTHHASPVMRSSITARASLFGYFLFPESWFYGAVIYMGKPHAAMLAGAVTTIHTYWVHTSLTADRALYRSPFWSRVTWWLERVVVFPSAHRAHHALGWPEGNYGMLFSTWDILFGTAYFSGAALPERYGINDPEMATFSSQIFWPFVPWHTKAKQATK